MPRSEVLATLRILRSLGSLPRARKRLPRQLPPDAVALAYATELLAFLDTAKRLVEREVLPRVRRLAPDARHDAAGDDDLNRLIDELSEKFFRAIPRGSLEGMAERNARKASDWQREQLRKQVKAALGVEIFREPSIAPLLGGFVSENVALIKSVPNRYLDDVEKTITRGLRAGLRHEAIAKELTERHKVAEASARLIARDQVGKFYGEVQEARQTALGVTSYTWRTVADNRVRPEHEELDGQTFEWGDAPADGHPGAAINCRCYAEPDFSGILKGL